MSRRTVEGCYARLTGLRDALMVKIDHFVSIDFITDYSAILEQLRSTIDDDAFQGFDLPAHAHRSSNTSIPIYGAVRQPIESKVKQLISYLEKVYNSSNRIVEVGSAYNLIQDAELKSRCSDLLSASDHFDRVINQATQVLEERLRLKAPECSDEIGIRLVNAAIKNNPNDSPVKFSDDQNEQEGYASIMRGIVGAFRNTSHHRFLANVSREQALQICAFIDNLLAALDLAEHNER